jgi:hypothetical protein
MHVLAVVRSADGQQLNTRDAAAKLTCRKGRQNWQNCLSCSSANSFAVSRLSKLRPLGATCTQRQCTGWSATSGALGYWFDRHILARSPMHIACPLRERWWRVQLACFKIGLRTYTG